MIFFKKSKNERLKNKIAFELGHSLLNYFKDDLDKTYEFIDRLKISNLIVQEKKKSIEIIIVLDRPGMFIGKKGQIINHIERYINETNDLKKIHIHLKETGLWIFYLYPYNIKNI
jgi:ribosomal protein S3